MQAQDRPGHLLSLKNIRKTFGGIRALKGVSLSLNAGEVLALVGENGAGKSTLVKVLTGIYHPEEGTIHVRGNELKFEDAHAAGRAGIAAVHQETAMFDELSAAENIYMGRQPMRNGRIDWATMNESAQKILTDIGAPFKAEALIRTLGPAERHLVEISRALSQDASVVILDEPTAALGVKQSFNVLKLIYKARERGLSVIFITHNVHHAYPVGDSFTLLNRGKSLGTYTKETVSKDEVLDMMAGGAEMQTLMAELDGVTI